jgi:PPOX class probable F420-dependent enzyme
MRDDTIPDRQRRFLEEPRIARLATTRPDGSPHVAPVWYRFEDGCFLILTDRGSAKHRNIERDSRAVLCIDDGTPPYHTVLVRGRVVVEAPRDAAWRLALATHYLGQERGRRYVEGTPAGDAVLLRLVPERVTGW